MKNITINLSAKCNAECSHCCFSCGPSSSEELSYEELWEIVNYGIQSKVINEISISGGEPFLNEELVCNIVEAVSKSGKIATCITNGFWAKTEEIARNKISNLCKIGLRHLTISFDLFHQDFINPQNIRNILLAANQLPMRISLNMAITKTHNGISLLNELSDCLLGVPITRFSVTPVGRAKENFDSSEFYYNLDFEKEIKCLEPGSGLVIHHDGYVYPCCSPLVFDTVLRIDSIRNDSINNIDRRFHSNLLLYILKKEGPGWFYKKCKENGYTQVQDRYISACHLCHDLFKDSQVINLLRDEINGYYSNEISKI